MPHLFLYPDFWIKTMRQGAVEDTFGEFDIKNDVMGAYYIYTDDNEQRHYYVIYFGDIGSRPDYIVDDTIIVCNPREYYALGEEPDCISLKGYVRRYAHECLNFGNVMEIAEICNYFGIEEGDFMRLVMLESEELMEYFSFDEEGYLERFEEKYGIEYTGGY